MNKKYLLLSLLTFCLSPAWGQVQKSMQERLWEGFQESLQQDVLRRENETFQNGINGLRQVLSIPYSRSKVQAAKGNIVQLRAGKQLTPERKRELSTYEQLISDYGNQVKRFLELFKGEITHPDYEIYQKDFNELIPPQIQTLAGILKGHYEQNGLDSLSFPEDYVYLNKKLKDLKNGFEGLDKINNREKLLDRLEAIVKMESEVSEEHKTYHTLKAGSTNAHQK